MNIHLQNRLTTATRRGFTLIEMLVVITIIAILASLSMPAYNAVMAKAHALQAKSVMQSMILAIKGYQTEYNHYPQVVEGVSGDSDGEPLQTMGTNPLVACIMGTDATTNPRQIVYLNPPIAKNGLNGYDSTSGNLTDPWGKPYSVMMDMNNDGIIKNPYSGASGGGAGPSGGSSGTSPNGPENLATGVIIWSSGPDKIDGTTGSSTDDLKSWQ